MILEAAARRVVCAFNALGKADGFMDSHAAHLECERAMVALSDALYEIDERRKAKELT
ncbi:hypothetical protein [Pseudoxanthomonas sacheonensis]|uniref:hypothetical protein n=1 Tax=Pseudoxanthomonas sacheonensis TaxID=443615 RepID=UPI0013D346EA|nr:hypothetical protein [Pseudoxanthomonas sacheonensis]